MYVNCICGKCLNKKEFNEHYIGCNEFYNIYKGFDDSINELIQKFLDKIGNLQHIKFIFEKKVSIIQKLEEQNNRNDKSKNKNNSCIIQNEIIYPEEQYTGGTILNFEFFHNGIDGEGVLIKANSYVKVKNLVQKYLDIVQAPSNALKQNIIFLNNGHKINLPEISEHYVGKEFSDNTYIIVIDQDNIIGPK